MEIFLFAMAVLGVMLFVEQQHSAMRRRIQVRTRSDDAQRKR